MPWPRSHLSARGFQVARRDEMEFVTALYFAVADLTGRGVEFLPQALPMSCHSATSSHNA